MNPDECNKRVACSIFGWLRRWFITGCKRAWQKRVFWGLMLLALLVSTWSSAWPPIGAAYAQLPNGGGEVLAMPAVVAETRLAVTPGLVTLETDDSLWSQGRRQYNVGQLSAALQSWKQLAQDSAVDPLQRSLGWSYVSIAAQDLDDWPQAESAIARSLSILADHPGSERTLQVRAKVLNAQGRLQLKKGQPEAAWETWTQAETAYRQLNDEPGSIGAKINQSQALQTMGLYRRARVELEAVAQQLSDQADSTVKAIALRSLGTVFQTAGSLERSKQYLTESLELYQSLGTPLEVADTTFALANTMTLMQDYEAALQHYQRVEALASDLTLHARSRINRLSVLLVSQQWSLAQSLLPELLTEVSQLPASRDSIFSRVNLVDSLLSKGDKDHQPMSWQPVDVVASLLSTGATQAIDLQDTRAQSFALGELSKLYGYTQQWPDAENLAQRGADLSPK